MPVSDNYKIECDRYQHIIEYDFLHYDIVEDSDEAKKSAQSYFFAVDDDKVLDPTNKSGFLENTLGFLGLLKTETLIARINEPPLGGDVNLYTEIKSNGVTVFAERDIFANGWYDGVFQSFSVES